MIRFHLYDSLHNRIELTYPAEKKSTKGYLIYQLRPDRKHIIKIELINDGESQFAPDSLTVEIPKLPTGELDFPRIEVALKQKERMEPGYTIFNPRRRLPPSVDNANTLNKTFGMLAMVDHFGEVVWYYQTDSRISDFDILNDGNLSYMTQNNKLVEIDFGGNILHEWYASNRPEGQDELSTPVNTLTFHHDAAKLSNGNWLCLSSEVREIDNYYTSETNKNAPRKKQKVMGDIVIEFNAKGEIVHHWNSFNYLPVFRIGYETFSNYWIRRGFPGVIDWSHANAVVPIENETAYLINYRYQSAMIKIDKASGDIVWIFAAPGGWGRDLTMKLLKIKEEDWSWHQHAPSFTADDNLLFFNNNNYLARPFDPAQPRGSSNSYVIEYKIDEKNMDVEKVWTSELEGESPIASIAMGSAAELPQTGNILAGFGMIISDREGISEGGVWTMAREFTHTTPATLVWEMSLLPKRQNSRIGWTLFGVKRITLD